LVKVDAAFVQMMRQGTPFHRDLVPFGQILDGDGGLRTVVRNRGKNAGRMVDLWVG
jgi:hypothetical protein